MAIYDSGDTRGSDETPGFGERPGDDDSRADGGRAEQHRSQRHVHQGHGGCDDHRGELYRDLHRTLRLPRRHREILGGGENRRVYAGGLLGEGFTTTPIDDQDRHFGFKAFGGYKSNRYFAVEGGYFDLGEFGFTADTMPAGSLRGNIKIKGVKLDVVGSVPIGDQSSLFARAGLNYADAKDSFAGTGAVAVINP